MGYLELSLISYGFDCVFCASIRNSFFLVICHRMSQNLGSVAGEASSELALIIVDGATRTLFLCFEIERSETPSIRLRTFLHWKLRNTYMHLYGYSGRLQILYGLHCIFFVSMPLKAQKHLHASIRILRTFTNFIWLTLRFFCIYAH
jgi:hypothetical protein